MAMQPHRILALSLLAPAGLALSLGAHVLLEPDQGHAVAGRLEGQWRIDPVVDARLGHSAAERTLAFREDSSFLDALPAGLTDDLRAQPVYESGLVTVREAGRTVFSGPYLLSLRSGNPSLLLLHEEEGVPLAGYDVAEVFLATGEERHQDLLLFREGDEFHSYQRLGDEAR
jgi:hypothetical protein